MLHVCLPLRHPKRHRLGKRFVLLIFECWHKFTMSNILEKASSLLSVVNASQAFPHAPVPYKPPVARVDLCAVLRA
jgi:hypothetical protein